MVTTTAAAAAAEPGSSCQVAPRAIRPSALAAGAIEHMQRMAGGADVARHVRAHQAEADEGDGRPCVVHACFSLLGPRSNSRRYMGLSGWRSTTTPNGASASLTALGSAPIAPITPPSDMPLLPVGVCRLGVCCETTSIGGVFPAGGGRETGDTP